MIYALSGVFYAFGGLLEAGRIGSATNNLGFMYELDAIAALRGGRCVFLRRGRHRAGRGDGGTDFYPDKLRPDLYRHQPGTGGTLSKGSIIILLLRWIL